KKLSKKTILIGSILTLLILLLLIFSLIFIFRQQNNKISPQTAYIYQDGILIEKIFLSQVGVPFSLELHNDQGGFNKIEIRLGEIGISEASCPDQICVHQGFISDSYLPITCLPNRIVIMLKDTATDDIHTEVPDAVSY
ncbi:NusG domain II-containing protein, partial [Lachnospiraceae bacterium OttesenSCG-928-D06]|nr:NusG domain II-containing protein [Lachnospiraceae bacterium OttesenSCG-928-D06]